MKPFHPWCRCTTVPYYEDMKGIGERWMRDPDTDQSGYVPSDMTYKEWKKIYVDKTSTMEEWKAKYVDEKMSASERVLPIQEKIAHTAEEYAEMVQYAEHRGISIFQVERFDGDTSVLYGQIDAFHEVRSEFGLTSKLTIGFYDLQPGDLAYTSKEGSSVIFDRNVLRNREATNAFLAADNRLATNDVKGIAYHEAGHLIAKRYGENGIDIALQSYYNVNKEHITASELKKYLFKSVSSYSVDVGEDKREPYRNKDYKEVIPEIFSKYKTNSDAFCNEFVRLFKEAHKV